MVADVMFRNQLVVSHTAHSRAPLVSLTCGAQEFTVQLTPDAALRLASELVQSAEVVVNESFMVNYLQQHLGLEAKDAYEALDQCRSWRERVYGAR